MAEQITPDVLDALANGRADGNVYYLPGTQLDRKLYMAVNEVLTRIGGKWNRKQKGHVFDDDLDAGQLVTLVVESKGMPPKNPTAFFPTPSAVADMLLTDARLPRIPQTATRILEPSAGRGALANATASYCQSVGIDAAIDVCEVLPRFRETLAAGGHRVVGEDFLTFTADDLYDAIVMNPPFAVESDRLAYVTHIERAWLMLAPGGVLLAIAPGGFTFRTDERLHGLHEVVSDNGAWIAAEDDAFKASGTGVRTVLIGATKPAEVSALFDAEQVA